MKNENLRSGDVVEIKTAAEIAATLDDEGMLDGLPFMPEMLKYCGRRLVIDKRADKICDTVHSTSSRRIPNTVVLKELRCDGCAHGGCQAECVLFWKEAWLRRVKPGDPSPPLATDHEAIAKRLQPHTRRPDANGELYSCQATNLYGASHHLRTLDPRPYFNELASGNVELGRFLKVVARAAFYEPLRKLGLVPNVRIKGKGTSPEDEPLELQPGDWVQVKTKKEIAATLNPKGKNRGLWFDVEMLPFCGRTYRVRKRVDRIIDDRNGRMVRMKRDCIMLDGVVCSGDLSVGRWFCTRAIYPYWRECWLRRVRGA
jgi:hypothetical protein